MLDHAESALVLQFGVFLVSKLAIFPASELLDQRVAMIVEVFKLLSACVISACSIIIRKL